MKTILKTDSIIVSFVCVCGGGGHLQKGYTVYNKGESFARQQQERKDLVQKMYTLIN